MQVGGGEVVPFEPTGKDVISTKRRDWNKTHPGNLEYAELLAEYARQLPSTKHDDYSGFQTEFADKVVRIITEERGGRFLKIQEGETNPSECIHMDYRAAVHKVYHGLKNKQLALIKRGDKLIGKNVPNRKPLDVVKPPPPPPLPPVGKFKLSSAKKIPAPKKTPGPKRKKKSPPAQQTAPPVSGTTERKKRAAAAKIPQVVEEGQKPPKRKPGRPFGWRKHKQPKLEEAEKPKPKPTAKQTSSSSPKAKKPLQRLVPITRYQIKQPPDGTNIDINPYALELITHVCNFQSAWTCDTILDSSTAEQEETDQERLIRLQLRHRFFSAKAVHMTVVEFSRRILENWGYSLEETTVLEEPYSTAALAQLSFPKVTTPLPQSMNTSGFIAEQGSAVNAQRSDYRVGEAKSTKLSDKKAAPPRGPRKEPRGPSKKEPRGPCKKEPRGPCKKEPRGIPKKEPRGVPQKEPRGIPRKEPRSSLVAVAPAAVVAVDNVAEGLEGDEEKASIAYSIWGTPPQVPTSGVQESGNVVQHGNVENGGEEGEESSHYSDARMELDSGGEGEGDESSEDGAEGEVDSDDADSSGNDEDTNDEGENHDDEEEEEEDDGDASEQSTES